MVYSDEFNFNIICIPHKHLCKHFGASATNFDSSTMQPIITLSNTIVNERSQRAHCADGIRAQ